MTSIEKTVFENHKNSNPTCIGIKLVLGLFISLRSETNLTLDPANFTPKECAEFELGRELNFAIIKNADDESNREIVFSIHAKKGFKSINFHLQYFSPDGENDYVNRSITNIDDLIKLLDAALTSEKNQNN